MAGGDDEYTVTGSFIDTHSSRYRCRRTMSMCRAQRAKHRAIL